MATTKDWSSLTRPCVTRFFDDGDVADWCVHTLPPWCRVFTVYNEGTGLLYVSVPAAEGEWVEDEHAVPIAAGASKRFVLELAAKPAPGSAFGTFGADGADHAIALLFEACVG